MFELNEWIKNAGYLGITAIIYTESGIFFGFIFPGDSLLFTAGFLASQGVFNVWLVIILCFLASVFGVNTGYWFGAKVGPKIFNKPNSLFFKQEQVKKAEKFYAKHGPKTLVLARFIPVVRTFAPILAGIAKMHYQTFIFYNILGAAIWTISLPLAGYFLGSVIPDIDKYLLPIVVLIIISSFLPSFFEILKDKENREYIKKFFHKN